MSDLLTDTLRQLDRAIEQRNAAEADRDLALARVRVEAARVERVRELLADDPCQGRDEPCTCLGCTTGGNFTCARSGPCSCLTCLVAEALR